MRWLFWSAGAVIAYTYFGYPAWLWVRGKWRSVPVRRAEFLPSISIVMVVRNEGAILERKLRNLLSLNYPADACEIVIVSDGSSDGTDRVLRENASSRIHSILLAEASGKAAGLNEALKVATHDVVVFTDARQEIESGALQLLMENFADASVGCASGELLLGDPQSGESARGVGLYWRMEKGIRQMESESGSAVGATGAFYAVRRNLLVSVPGDTILDDVFIPMNVARQGFRVVFDDRAHAWDLASQGTGREFARKVRTLTGNYQLLQLAPWLLTGRNPIRFEFVSHKLCRLFVPFALAAVLVSSALLSGAFFRIVLLLQLAFYALGMLAVVPAGRGLVSRGADAAFTFVLLNAAAVVAFGKFVSGRKPVWTR
ncbi:MAG TPA: glycosyltransferase family 2 protein [Terriglobales bacterium]|nr:glycosyltransferase family 2 protein [Terriglobales bacterium]